MEMTEADINYDNKRETFLQYLRKCLLEYTEKEVLTPKEINPSIHLDAWHELECALIHDLKSTYQYTDEQIEEIKKRAFLRHEQERKRVAEKGDYI
jgi:hypothetical protein